MKHWIMSGRFNAYLLAVLSAAIDPAIAAERDSMWELTGRVGLVSNYISRGYSQTWWHPAAQVEIEVAHDNGFYAGGFTSNVSPHLYPGGSVEVELWAGYEHKLGRDFTVMGEANYSIFPGANYKKGVLCAPLPTCPDQKFNTSVGRIGVGWRWLSTRIAYSFSDYFGDSQRTGFDRSTRGTLYWDTNAAYPWPNDHSWKLVGHLGYTRYSAHYIALAPNLPDDTSYWDWRVGVTKTYGKPSVSWTEGWRVGAFYAQANMRLATPSLLNGSLSNLGRPTIFVSLEKLF